MANLRLATQQIIEKIRADRGGGKAPKLPSPSPQSIRDLRTSLGMTREQFASCFGLQVGTLRDWEQDLRHPDQAATVLLRIIERHPDMVAQTVEKMREGELAGSG